MTTPLLRVEALSKAFGGLAVSRDISMDIHAGDRIALIGPNGAGKTTFVNLLTGRLRPDRGRILLEGVDVTAMPTAERARRGLIRSFQISRLFLDMTTIDHLRLALLQREGRSHGILRSAQAYPAVEEEAREILDQFGLSDIAEMKVGRAAYGQHRLLEIALSFAMRSRVLLLDEPAAGVSRQEMPRILSVLEALPADMAVLMIEHDLELAFRFARSVVVLAAGSIIYRGTPADVVEDAEVREVYLGSFAGQPRSDDTQGRPANV